MMETTERELQAAVYVSAGDALQASIPGGLISQSVRRAMSDLSQLAVQVNPEAMRTYVYVPVGGGVDVYDLPYHLKAIESVALVDSEREEALDVPKSSPSGAIAADVLGRPYYWHYVDARRVRLQRPEGERARDIVPGLRFFGVKQFALPTDQDARILLPDSGFEFVRYRAAMACQGAPGAIVDLPAMQGLFATAREDVIRTMVFFDASAGAAITDTATIP
jgi:hypothetical protein